MQRMPLLKVFQKQSFSILPFESMKWLIFTLAFLSLLTSSTFLGARTFLTMINTLDLSLSSEITLEIPYQEGSNSEETTRQIATRLKNIEGIKNIRIISTEESKTLLKPWLEDIPDIPLPSLLAVILEENTDVELLKKDVEAVAPNVTIDTHNQWKNILSKARQTIIITTLYVFVLVIFITTLMCVYATRSERRRLTSILVILEDLGTTPTQIKTLIAVKFFSISLIGSIIGVLFLFILLILTQFFFFENSPFYTHLLYLLPLPSTLFTDFFVSSMSTIILLTALSTSAALITRDDLKKSYSSE